MGNKRSRNRDGKGKQARLPLLDSFVLPIEFEFGMPHPLMNELDEQVLHDDPRRAEIIAMAEVRWLRYFVEEVPRFRLTESAGVNLLSDIDTDSADQIVYGTKVIRRSLQRIMREAFDIAFDLEESDTLLVFSRISDYISYVSRYYPDGEHAESGGMCIRNHLSLHIAMPYIKGEWEPTLVHELAHLAISSLPLPLWLEEGIVQIIENELAPRQYSNPLNAGSLIETKKHWRKTPLESFWSGDAFYDVESQAHAYQLAYVLVRLLLSDCRQQLIKFVKSAHYEDRGAYASEQSFSKSLDELAATFLGNR